MIFYYKGVHKDYMHFFKILINEKANAIRMKEVFAFFVMLR